MIGKLWLAGYPPQIRSGQAGGPCIFHWKSIIEVLWFERDGESKLVRYVFHCVSTLFRGCQWLLDMDYTECWLTGDFGMVPYPNYQSDVAIGYLRGTVANSNMS